MTPPLLNIALFVISLSFLGKPDIWPSLSWSMVWSFTIYILDRASGLGMANWSHVKCQFQSVGGEACALLRRLRRPITTCQEELPWRLKNLWCTREERGLKRSTLIQGKQGKMSSVTVKLLPAPCLLLAPGYGRVGLGQSHFLQRVKGISRWQLWSECLHFSTLP